MDISRAQAFETVRIDMRPAGTLYKATATVAGRDFTDTSRNALTNVARQIVGAGLPSDATWTAGRSGRVDLFGPSIARLAELTVSEPDNRSPAFVKYRPLTPHWPSTKTDAVESLQAA